MAKKVTKKGDDKKLFAFLAVLLSIVGFVIALLAKREDRYVMFYAKESLVLFIALIIVSAINWVFSLIPIIGGFIGGLVVVAWIVIWVIAMINSLSGKEKETPITGQYAQKIDL